MDGDGRVTEHGFWSRGGDDDELLGAGEGIADVPELAFARFVDDFEIAEGRLAARAPIDHVAAAIDEILAIEAEKGFHNGAVHRRVECETFARPVAGDAEADHLLFDVAAAFGLPLPDAALKFVAADFLALQAFLGELAFNDDLRRDAGVVNAREPESAAAGHAAPADEDVDLGVFEHVADVDGAGDIGRRNGDGENLSRMARFGAVELVFKPGLSPAPLDFLRFICLGDFARHGFGFPFTADAQKPTSAEREANQYTGQCGGASNGTEIRGLWACGEIIYLA